MICRNGLVIAIACISCLSGCVTRNVTNTADSKPAPSSVEQREAKLLALTQFQFNGGLGIWTDEQSISTRINWLQQPDNLSVNLSGPLGIGNLRMSQEGQSTTVIRGDQVVASGPSADRVLQQALGLQAPVPLKQLQMWVRGLPGNASSVVRDSQGRLASLRFKDAGGTTWQARFKRYTISDSTYLPALVTASGGPYSIRLTLRNWQIGNTATVPEMQHSNKRLSIPGR